MNRPVHIWMAYPYLGMFFIKLLWPQSISMETLINFYQEVDPAVQLKLLMLSIIGFMIYKMHSDFILALKSKSWPTIEAVVTESSIDRFSNQYQPKIIYKYQYQGKEYINDTYTHLGAPGFTKKSAIKIAQTFSEGGKVVAHFDPAEPTNSTLVPGIHWAQWLMAGVILAFFLGVGFLPELVGLIEYFFPSERIDCP